MPSDPELVRCGWCHRPIDQRPGGGRPRKFCTRSHRQRAYEARKRAEAAQLTPDRCIVGVADLARLHDRLYRLEAAVEDVTSDIADDPGPQTWRAAVDHLLDAASDLVGVTIEPVRD